MFIPYRASHTSAPPSLRMISDLHGLAIFRTRPRGQPKDRFEIRLYSRDLLFGGWHIVGLRDTYATQAEAIEAAESYLSSVDEHVWPATQSVAKTKRNVPSKA